MSSNQNNNAKKDDEDKEKINENIIIAYFQITVNNLKNRIINSYENVKREGSILNLGKFSNIKENEKDIKDCDIFINDSEILFKYFYEFPKEGNYKIKYVFTNLLTSTNFMFYDCKSLISVDLSNFKSQNVENMAGMFFGCHSLESIDFLNIQTQNVENMSSMFFGCNLLKKLNLSQFNTEKVKDMRSMFQGCSSLTSLDLSNFNFKNLIYM